MMDGMNMNALQFEASVLDGPVINSRAGLYIYINALVSMLSLSYEQTANMNSSLADLLLMMKCY